MRFKFKLESLLSHRQFVEDVIQKEYVLAGRRLTEEKQVETHLREKHAHLAAQLKQNLREPKPVSENRLYVTYLSCLSDRIVRQQRKIQETESERSEKKIALLRAVKKRKILERLKETHADRHRQLHLKTEQEISDEIGIQQFNRKTGS